MSIGANRIPRGWVRTTLGDVLPLTYGKALTRGNRSLDGEYPVYGSSGVVGHHNVPLTKGPAIVIGRKGSVGEVHYSPMPCWAIDTAYYVEATASLNLPYFTYLLKSLNLAQLDRSTAIPGLSRDDYNVVEVPIAPVQEQQRIVAAIEEQFTRLDAAVAGLKRTQANLKRYRAAVLAAACSGRLVPTEAELARQEGRDYEPADQLLQRSLLERHERGLNSRASKKSVRASSDQAEYENSVLPEGWTRAPLESLVMNHDGRRIPVKSSDRAKRQGAYPYYGASGVIDSIDDYLFDGSYLLVAEDGANLLSRTTPIAFEASGKFWVNNHAHVLEPLSGIELHYLASYLNGSNLQFFITGSAQPKLTQAALNRIQVPLPPELEQTRIVNELERQLSVVADFERSIIHTLTRAERLRQSILRRAFEGTLIPQDSTDEPADVLLERIREERTATTPTGKQRKTGARRSTQRSLFDLQEVGETE